MVKAAAAGPGIYSATYSGIPVYEFQFGSDLKEHVMRRRHDDWINATHILKAAGFDKPARTRILERDVQKEVHEKIQGGYGKYQGTWIPLDQGETLATRHGIYDRLRPIFEFVPGNESPPPAPRHASKPKAPKSRPPVPRWSNHVVPSEDAENGDVMMVEDDTPDNMTLESASFVGEDDRFDLSHPATGHRKRKRDEQQDFIYQEHSVYGDELLDYFLLSRNEQPAVKPDPPANFQPNWTIDQDGHTALHWAAAMGDVGVIKQLKRFNANLAARNVRGETAFMKSCHFTNGYEKQSYPAVLKEIFETFDARDNQGCTVIHHAATMKNGRVFSPVCSRYYLDNILNKLQETLEPAKFQQLLDAQDNEGNTALHLAALRNARKNIRALLGRHASTDIPNHEGVHAEDLIMELNATKKQRGPAGSSSPFDPDSQRRASFRDAFGDKPSRKPQVPFQSAAAAKIQSRILPLVTGKFQDLARSYDEEFREKTTAEAEARRLLASAQAELNAVHQQVAELEAQLEPDEIAAKTMNEANLAKHQVLSLITHQTRLQIHQTVEQELSCVNGDSADDDDKYEERLQLARQLSQLLAEQRQVEAEYVDALSMVGVGDKIDKYRKLLKLCLEPKDGESLDMNLDNLIEMMEEEKNMHDVDCSAGGEVMEI